MEDSWGAVVHDRVRSNSLEQIRGLETRIVTVIPIVVVMIDAPNSAAITSAFCSLTSVRAISRMVVDQLDPIAHREA